MKHLYFSLLILLQSITILGHGFAADTLVLLADNTWQQVSAVCHRTFKKKIAVASHDTESSFQTPAPVVRGGRSQANCYIRLDFGESNCHRYIACTPVQEFYNATTRQWVPAYMLKIGDKLLCAHNVTKTVASLALVKESLEIYTIQVKDTHTFFVSHHSVLTHNIPIPLVFNLGLGIPFGAAACGTVGGFFGPPTLLIGAAIGCAVGVLAKIVCGSRVPSYTVEAYDTNSFEQRIKQQQLQTTILSEPQVIQNPGCGDTTPQKPLVLVTPAEPMPVFQNPGYVPLPEVERDALHIGGCGRIPDELKDMFNRPIILTAEINDDDKVNNVLEDMKRNAKPGTETNGKSKQYIKKGGFEAAEKDFETLQPFNIRPIPGGFVGDLSNGQVINVRIKSREGSPTLEIFNPANKKKIKFRYNDKI